MEDTRIYPWIGSEYESGGIFGKRVMFLGLSSYLSEEKRLGKTTAQLNAHLSEDTREFGVKRSKRARFWTNIQHLGLGKSNAETSNEERESFWHSIALYNYVPFVVADGARKDPSDDHMKRAHEEFIHIMKRHQPDRLVVMSWMAHHALKKFADYENVLKVLSEIGGHKFQIRGLNINSHQCLTMRVRHPSGGLSWGRAHEAFRQLLSFRSGALNPHSSGAA